MQTPATTQVVNADVTFTISSDGKKLGELNISKGSLDWKPSGRRESATVQWEQFDAWMRDHGGFE
jgi:hypothetical protein